MASVSILWIFIFAVQVTNFEDTKKGKQMVKGGSTAKKVPAPSKAGKGGKQGAANGRAHEDEDSDEADADVADADTAKEGEEAIPSGTAKSAESAPLMCLSSGSGQVAGAPRLGQPQGQRQERWPLRLRRLLPRRQGRRREKRCAKWDGEGNSKMKDFSKPLEEGMRSAGLWT